jgi:hypothetical protein
MFSYGDDTGYGVNDTIRIELLLPPLILSGQTIPYKVSQPQLDEWIQATSPVVGSQSSVDISLGKAYTGTFVTNTTLEISILDAKGASQVLLDYGEDALNFRVSGNLSDSVGGIIYGGGATKGNATYSNTIGCGEPGERATSHCRVNISTYPKRRPSGLRSSFITQRNGSFGAFHVKRVFLSHGDQFDGSENCTVDNAQVYFNIMFSHTLRRDGGLNRNVLLSKTNISGLLDFKRPHLLSADTEGEFLDVYMNDLVLLDLSKVGNLIFTPATIPRPGNLFLERISKFNPLTLFGSDISFIAFGDSWGDGDHDRAVLVRNQKLEFFNISYFSKTFSVVNDSTALQWFNPDNLNPAALVNGTVAVGGVSGYDNIIAVGDQYGRIGFWKNLHSPVLLKTMFYELPDMPFARFSTVAVGHLHGSTTVLSILVGHANGLLRYFSYDVTDTSDPKVSTTLKEHVGTHIFSMFNGTGITRPSFYDFDDDGDLDLIYSSVSQKDATSYFETLENVGGQSNPVFIQTKKRFAIHNIAGLNRMYTPSLLSAIPLNVRKRTVMQLKHLNMTTLMSTTDVDVKVKTAVVNYQDLSIARPGYSRHLKNTIQNIQIVNPTADIVSIVEGGDGNLYPVVCSSAPSIGDTLQVHKFRLYFNKPVGKNSLAVQHNMMSVNSLFSFNKNIGSDYSGTWLNGFTYEININDRSQQAIDVRGRLSVAFVWPHHNNLTCVISNRQLNNSQGPIFSYPLSKYVERFEVFGTNCSLNKGSRLKITFNREVVQQDVSSFENISNFIMFSPNLGANYTGSWLEIVRDEAGKGKSTLEITIDHVHTHKDSLEGLRGIFVNNSLQLDLPVINQTLPSCNWVTGATPLVKGSFALIPDVTDVQIKPGDNKGRKYGAGVYIDITVSTEKTQYEVGEEIPTKEEIEKLFKPNINIGESYRGVWIMYNMFRIIIENPEGHDYPQPGNLYFTTHDALKGKAANASVVCSASDRQISPHERVYAQGDFAGALRIVSAVAVDGCTPLEYGIGDKIEITLSQSAMEDITGRPAMAKGRPQCTLENFNNLGMSQKYACLKLAIYDFLKLESGSNAVCVGYISWLQWTTLKTFVIFIDDPRDDCTGMEFAVPEYGNALARTNTYPPEVIDDNATSIYTKMILEDTGTTDSKFATRIKLNGNFPGKSLGFADLRGKFTGGFAVEVPNAKHVIIDLKVLYSLVLEKLALQGRGFKVFIPKTTAREYVTTDKDKILCCGEIAGCECEAFDNEDQFDILTSNLILCMDNLDCPRELIPYVTKATAQTGNVEIQENCNDIGGTCLMGKEATTRVSSEIFFLQASFGIPRGLNPEGEVIQDKLGGGVVAHFYNRIAGEYSTEVGSIGFITSIKPSRADSGVPIPLTITGTDFDNNWKTGGYTCHFVDTVGNVEITDATVFGTRTLKCSTPVWLYTSRNVSVIVYRFGTKLQTGFCDEKICKTTDALITVLPNIQLFFYESSESFTIPNATITGGVTYVKGNGFNTTSRDYRCRFQFGNKSTHFTLSPPAFPLSSTHVVCVFPPWPFEPVQVEALLLHHNTPVQKRDASTKQKFALRGACSLSEQGSVAFVIGIGIKALHFEHRLTVLFEDEAISFNATFSDDDVKLSVDSLILGTVIPGLLTSEITSVEATIPEGVSKIWYIAYRTTAKVSLVPKVSIQPFADPNIAISYVFVENGLFWPSSCIFCPPAIKSGWSYACLRSSEDRFKCWGDNGQGQVFPSVNPVMMPSKRHWVPYKEIQWDSFSPGYTHTCGIRAGTGEAVCFGLKYPGLQIKLEAPAELSFSSVSTGAYHTCGVTVDGRVSCWGEQLHGKSAPPNSTCHRKELGFMSSSAVFVDPKTLACTTVERDDITYIRVEASASHSCAIDGLDGAMMCWGNNADAQLGMTDCPGSELTRFERSCARTTGPFKDLGLGPTYTCGQFFDGTVLCWGQGMASYSVPTHSFRTISYGGKHACGIIEKTSKIECWGANNFGQAMVPADNGYVEVSTGESHTCAIKGLSLIDPLFGHGIKTVICWGTINGVTLQSGVPNWRGYGLEDDPGHVTVLSQAVGTGERFIELCFPKIKKEICNNYNKIYEPGFRRCATVNGCGNKFYFANENFQYRLHSNGHEFVGEEEGLGTVPSKSGRMSSPNSFIYVNRFLNAPGLLQNAFCIDFYSVQVDDFGGTKRNSTIAHGEISGPGGLKVNISVNTSFSAMSIQQQSLQGYLRTQLQHQTLDIHVLGRLWCFNKMPDETQVYFRSYFVWRVGEKRYNCTTDERTTKSKAVILEANSEYRAIGAQLLDYRSSYTFLLFLLSILLLLPPTSWAERLLYEANKDNLDRSVLSFT